MKYIDNKRSHAHIIDVGDLFSYAINPNRFKVVVRKMTSMIDIMLNNNALMEELFRLEGIDLYEKIVDMKVLFNSDRIEAHINHKQAELKHYRIMEIINIVLKDFCDQAYYEVYMQIHKQIVLETYRIIIKEISRNEHDFLWIKLSSFDIRWLYQLDKKIVGFSVPKEYISEQNVYIAKLLNVMLIEENTVKENQAMHMFEAPYHMNQLCVYLQIADMKPLEDVNQSWYKGIYFLSEYQLFLKGLMVTKEEAYRLYSDVFKYIKDKQICITIPTFTDKLYPNIDPTIRTEIDQFSFTHGVLKNWIEGLSQAICDYNPNLTFIIPHLNSMHDLYFWNYEINVLFIQLKNDYQVGMTIETEAALQYCDDFEHIKPAIFLIDELVKEYNDQKTTPDIFDKEMRLLIDDLKHAHYIFRLKQPKTHIVLGKMLKETRTLRKFINLGFRAFALTTDMLDVAREVFEKWEKTRGKFKKNEK